MEEHILEWRLRHSCDRAQVGRRALGDESAAAHHTHSIADPFDETHHVRRSEDCSSAFALFPDPVSQLAHHLDIQSIEVFVENQYLRPPKHRCRQTDLLLAAGRTGKVINVKKGQFLAPWDMKNVVAKVVGAGNPNVLVTERGVSFGYNTLVSDMRALPILVEMGAPVIFDATHSVQQPGGQGTSSGGERRFVPVLARAAVAVGVAGVFIETHQDPDRAPSDGPNMLPLKELEPLLAELIAIDRLTKKLSV